MRIPILHLYRDPFQELTMTDALPVPPEFANSGLTVRAVGTVPPRRFQVLGERSSCTNLLRRLMMRHSPLEASEVLGWKHGFPHMVAVPGDLAVLGIVRNAADWARSMHSKPWHTPPHMQRMTFAEFSRAPGETVVDRARYFGGPEARPLVGRALQHDRDPISGAPYANLFALRSAKIRALTGMFRRDCTMVLIRMEDMQTNPEAVISAVCEGLSLPTPATPFKPFARRLGSKFKPSVEQRPATPATLSAQDMDFLRAQTDPEVEAALGYAY